MFFFWVPISHEGMQISREWASQIPYFFQTWYEGLHVTFESQVWFQLDLLFKWDKWDQKTKHSFKVTQ